jgi:hypothetical protein
MSEFRERITQAIEHAERGLSEARYLDPNSSSFDHAIFTAWDQLQTAAKILDGVRYDFQVRERQKP